MNAFLDKVKENLDKPIIPHGFGEKSSLDKVVDDWRDKRKGEIHRACNCVDDQGFSLRTCKGDCYGAQQYEATIKAMGYFTPDNQGGKPNGIRPAYKDEHSLHCQTTPLGCDPRCKDYGKEVK